jgi:hypothetical protein
MKCLLSALLLLLGFGAQAAALPCAQGETGAHQIQATIHRYGAQTAVALDRIVHEQHCDCPARDDGAQAAVIETEKSFFFAPTERFVATADPSFAELRRVLDAQSRFDSDASPASRLPPYLLTARLRF